MKFFKKRLCKRKPTKSLTEETSLIAAPIVHQHDNNHKPLSPSPSSCLISMPPQQPVTMAEKGTETTHNNSDGWLELNLPNDFSSSFDLPPQLQQQQQQQNQSQATISNHHSKLEINTENPPPNQEPENITETCSLFSYPDNHINTTTTHNQASTPKGMDIVAAALKPSRCSTPDAVDGDDKNQNQSPLQSVEKQGDLLLLNDTFRDANVLANATLIPTDDMQYFELEEKERDELSEIEHGVREEKQIGQETAVASDAGLALSPSPSPSPSASALSLVLEEQDTAVIERGDDTTEGVESPNSSNSAEQAALQQADELPVQGMCTIDNTQDLDNLRMVASPPSLTTLSSPSETAPLEETEELVVLSQADSIEREEDASKIAKQRSAISLIPRKQQPSVNAHAKKNGSRRASSNSSFIPVLTTRHQHQNTTPCSIPTSSSSKDGLTTTTVVPVVTWSPSSSSERNSVVSSSSDSASSSSSSSNSSSSSSCGSQHQEKNKTSLQLVQSKIPKASFVGMPPLTAASTENSNKVQHVSRLPTKRNSTLA